MPVHLQSLNGAWTLVRSKTRENFSARVPGTVHEDLLRASFIPDPYYRDNELAVQWVGEEDWSYERHFDVNPDLLKHDRVLLRCHGLDTFGVLSINNQHVGTTNNMHRVWEFDVKKLLRAGKNHIRIRFVSVLPYIRKQQTERNITVAHADFRMDGGAWVRKQQSNFGWDWGPKLVTSGIWKNIELIAFSEARITGLLILQRHGRNHAEVTAEVSVECLSRHSLSVRACLTLDGAVIAEAIAPVIGGKAPLRLSVDSPRLWWPNGMGAQPLYELEVSLLDENGAALDVTCKRVGLRTLHLRRQKDKWGESFEFLANGVPFFAKGACWIPADAIYSRCTPELYRQLLEDAKEAHMNMLRVWGGGHYEHDWFYDLCDELGLCVWQDFMFACASYPADRPDFMANVKAEIREQVRRLRHHASLAVWNGNNELLLSWVKTGASWPYMPVALYKKLFHEVIPAIVAEEDPQRDYWPTSPFSSLKPRFPYEDDPTSGNSHLWSVWHGREPFEWYRSALHRFCTEFGFQSFPEPATVRGYTLPEDRNITSRVMEHHQRSGIGNARIIEYMLSWFRMPAGFDDALWLSQLLQGLAIKYAVEHWRRHMARCRGATYWQLNDCWPVASWASIDYHGRWKALHYMAKRFFAPVLVSILEDKEKRTFELHVSSDAMQPFDAMLSWKLTTTDGKPLFAGRKVTRIPAGKSIKVKTLRLGRKFDSFPAERILCWAELCHNKETLSTNLATLAPYKHLEMATQKITHSVRPSANGFLVTLSADKPALWVWLTLRGMDAQMSDNWVCLAPDRPVSIQVIPKGRISIQQFRRRLQIHHLHELFNR